MALRVLGRKLMIVKPQELGFCFNNSYRTAAPAKLPLKKPARGLRDSRIRTWNLLWRENRRLEGENCRLKEERHPDIEGFKPMKEELKDVQRDIQECKDALQKDEETNKNRENAIEDFLGRMQENMRTKLKDDASDTINDLLEWVRRLEQKILGDLQHDIQNERDRCKSLEIKLEDALQKIEEMKKEQHNSRFIEEENLMTQLKDASNNMNELIENVKWLLTAASKFGFGSDTLKNFDIRTASGFPPRDAA
ncbi:hypothetical protein RHSIM_Rhsim12G0177100 [Rhododendron simsii]|uniref:Uncharacterized protein n=1 Tax=Rhododendron simsii TaxID=118357 RepID=A0A834L9M3_RHOSS|nr:hypothetical protein RHSIM_Rhsim12G0177100 [Rhododendron simsii]